MHDEITGVQVGNVDVFQKNCVASIQVNQGVIAYRYDAFRVLPGLQIPADLFVVDAWQRSILHFCREGGGGDNQFLVTTHSESLLRYVDPECVVRLV